MGKIDELIDKEKNRISRNKQAIKSAFATFTKSGLELCNEMLEGFVKDLEQLKSSLPTQQDKVVVPRFVAEYLEMRKEQFPDGGLGVAIIHVFDGKGSPELFNWMNSNTEVFARAWLDGCTVEKEPKTHYLKIAPVFYRDVVSGKKKFEIRINDRSFLEGDHLILQEFEDGKYTGNEIEVLVTYIPDFPLPDNYVVMGIVPVEEEAE